DVHKLLHVQAFSAREFLETIVYKDLSPKDGPKCCIIISMPTAGEIKDPAHAHGVYTSVETLREVGDGKVEVIMSLTSNAGGNIPRWMQNMAMAGQILSDGQRFFKFLREQPKPAEV
ncbi:hypothetical protein BZA05DRAFT_334645, partial [Tricharina praecox]|uniref:uncharacterized protein n=1 Tax=Tricharina praecox TaxID=43433 RepID=UPI0022209D29